MWQDKKGTYIIAEIGVNHNGDVGLAKKLIDESTATGADAVKFQTFRAENLVTKNAPKAYYQTVNDSRHKSQFEMLKSLELPESAFAELATYAKKVGIDFLSTPFDFDSADLLERIGVRAFKVSSGDLNNLSFMAHLARKKLPMIISTGMSTLAEVDLAVDTIRNSGDPVLAILHCVSNYPAQLQDANLRVLQTIAQAFGKTVGWSDHTIDDTSAVIAVTLGARIIEKHITLDKNMEGPDHKASMNMAEFKAYVDIIRATEQALGDGIKRVKPAEVNTRAVATKSLTTRCNIKAGEILSNDNLTAKRPGGGISAQHYFEVQDRIALHDIPSDTQIDWSMLGEKKCSAEK